MAPLGIVGLGNHLPAKVLPGAVSRRPGPAPTWQLPPYSVPLPAISELHLWVAHFLVTFLSRASALDQSSLSL